MKVKHLIELLQRHDPELEVITDDYNGDRSNQSHGRVRVWRGMHKGRTAVVISRFTSARDEDRGFYRTALTNSDAGIESEIQTYKHLRARTEEEAAEDLAAGAITQHEHDEDVARIRQLNAEREQREQDQARHQYETLKARFG